MAGAVGDDGGHSLPDEPHDVVENVGVIGVVEPVLVPGGRERHRRAVAMGEDQPHAGHPFGRGGVDRQDPGVGEWAAQHGHVQQALGQVVHGVLLGPGDDPNPSGRTDRAAGIGCPAGLLGVGAPGQRVGDGPIPRAPAQVALQLLRQIGELVLGTARQRW